MPYVGAMGLGIGEVLDLRVGRLDLMSRTPTLRVAETIGEADGHLFTKGPKAAARRRVLPLPAQLAEMLAAHLARRGLTAADPDELVFVAPKGGPIRRTHFRSRVWAPACRRAGLEGLGFHDLRRSAATVLVVSGTSIRDAQDILGHADGRMLLSVYAQSTEEGKRAAIDRLGAFFMDGPASDLAVSARS